MAQLPFATLDVSGDYITHDVVLYAHGHATEPDGINAAVKSIEAALQAFDLDDYDLGGGDTVGGLVTVATSRAARADECAGHVLEATASGVTFTLPDSSTLPDNARVLLTCGTGSSGFAYACSGSDTVYFPQANTSYETYSASGDHSFLSLRKVSGGWLCIGSEGVAFGG